VPSAGDADLTAGADRPLLSERRRSVRSVEAEPISVVLVDDSPELRSVVGSRLRLSRRFDVVGEAGTGAEALRVVADVDPDLVLLDVSMPDMDGLDALTHLRELAPRTTVVLFSGFEEQGLADRARRAGAVDFIEKSVPLDQLAGRLEAAVRGADAVRLAAGPGRGASSEEPILQEHLERFRAAFDQAAIGMATLTLTGRIVRANDAFGIVVGADREALVGARYASLAGDTEVARLAGVIAEVASGTLDVSSVEHDLVSGVTVLATVAVVRDSRLRPLYLFLQVQDVTERRHAEEQLRRSEERFRLLVEAVQDYAIFMLDPTGHVVSWNAGAQRAKGYTADEVLGQHFRIFYPEEAAASGHPERELEVAVAEGRYEEEGWRVRKDGSTFWANVLITAVRDGEGNLVGFAKVTRDVTERRQLLQDLERAAEGRAQILAVTAHELRTPVAVINGFGSTLREHWHELDDAQRLEMIGSLSRSGERLSRLVDDLFTASRLESGALEVRREAVDLVAVVREAVADLSAEGATTIASSAASTVVCADRGRVQQMVTNYLTNAMRYGAAPITVTVAVADGSDMASLVVSDAGTGVDDAMVPRLFGRFAAGGSHDGSGLGLFIVGELARAQGGAAWYERATGGGASFGFRLPLWLGDGTG
jgi:PAS domain S-box-containing protein